MTEDPELRRFVVSLDGVPPKWPTNRHRPEFWESLGRAVATFGFLEETLGKAIFAFTGTRPIESEDGQFEFEGWVPTLIRSLTESLGSLIDLYEKSVRSNNGSTLANLAELLLALRKASNLRNALCHGSWRTPDNEGYSVPFFINKKNELFQDPIDVAYLEQVQEHVTELICAVITTVTHMGWQFPGSNGPGVPILSDQFEVSITD